MSQPGSVGGAAGLWVQTVAVAAVSGIVVTVQRYRVLRPGTAATERGE